MKKELYNKIKDNGDFDGTYVEMYLNTPINYDKGMDIVRLITTDNGEVLAHILDKDDNSTFENFDVLDTEIQNKIYSDVMGSN